MRMLSSFPTVALLSTPRPYFLNFLAHMYVPLGGRFGLFWSGRWTFEKDVAFWNPEKCGDTGNVWPDISISAQEVVHVGFRNGERPS